MTDNQASERTWELGLFAASVSQLTPQQTVALLDEAGYGWVEWRVQTAQAIESSPWGRAYNTLALDHLARESEQVAAALASGGVRVSGLQVDVSPAAPDAAALVLDAAQALKCPLVLLAGPGYDPAQGQRAARDAFAARIEAWVRCFEGSGVRICVENHMWTIVPSISLVMDLLHPFSPKQVGVMWDPANGVCEGSEIPAMALDLVGPYLAEVHLKNGAWMRGQDGRWAFDWTDLMEGMVDWHQVLDLLQHQGYRGPLVVEDYRPGEPAGKLVRARQGLQAALAAGA